MFFRWKSRKEAARKAAMAAAAEDWNHAHARYHERRDRGDTRGQNTTWPALFSATNDRLRVGA